MFLSSDVCLVCVLFICDMNLIYYVCHAVKVCEFDSAYEFMWLVHFQTKSVVRFDKWVKLFQRCCWCV